tara:strand:+ start:604 stop:1041 length:438 start_codon:yes stop_codon:yes gene_type:complete
MNTDIKTEIEQIKLIVEDQAGVPYGSIDSNTRKQEIVKARIVFASFLMEQVGLKVDQLTEYVNRDRTNFYHYQKKHEGYMSDRRVYPEYFDLYNNVNDAYFSQLETLFDNETKNDKLVKLDEIEKDIRNLKRKHSKLTKAVELTS